jgi:hypothetical protein
MSQRHWKTRCEHAERDRDGAYARGHADGVREGIERALRAVNEGGPYQDGHVYAEIRNALEALLAHQPPPSERPMHVGGSAATQDGIAGEMSVAACSNCGCSRPKVHFQGYGPSELGVCPECGTADDLCRKCARPPGDCRCCEPSARPEVCETCNGGKGVNSAYGVIGVDVHCPDCGGTGRAT